MASKCVLVTGAVGFIGGHLSRHLLDAGYTVIGLDNFDPYYDPEIKRARSNILLAHEAFQLIEGDIRSPASLARIFKSSEVDAVVHLAARPGVRASMETPDLYTEINLTGTTRLLQASRSGGVRRFVFGSSSSVYGLGQALPSREAFPASNLLSPYAVTKRAGELMCRSFHNQSVPGDSLEHMTCLRFFTVFGPEQRPDMALAKFTRALIRSEPITLFGANEGTARDFTHVDDIVMGIVAALEGARGFGVYNLGTGRSIALDTAVEIIASELGVVPDIRHMELPSSDPPVSLADITKARRELGYSPRKNFEESLRQYVQLVRKQCSKESVV